MSTQTTTIAQKLQMTPEQYEELIFGAYARWCESVTLNPRELQKALASAAINKWYLTEYAKCERECIQLTHRYEKSITVEDFKRCYNDCTYGMFNIRPTALLQEIKKTQVVSYLKIHGLRIPSLTFNQN